MRNMEPRQYNAMGFCQKAGRCQSGDFAAEKAVRAGKARLVLLEQSASQNTRDKYEALCRGRGVPLLLVEEVGSAIGKPGRLVMAVTYGQFARMIQEAGNPSPAQSNSKSGE